jgi:hypothetical protein
MGTVRASRATARVGPDRPERSQGSASWSGSLLSKRSRPHGGSRIGTCRSRSPRMCARAPFGTRRAPCCCDCSASVSPAIVERFLTPHDWRFRRCDDRLHDRLRPRFPRDQMGTRAQSQDHYRAGLPLLQVIPSAPTGTPPVGQSGSGTPRPGRRQPGPWHELGVPNTS